MCSTFHPVNPHSIQSPFLPSKPSARMYCPHSMLRTIPHRQSLIQRAFPFRFSSRSGLFLLSQRAQNISAIQIGHTTLPLRRVSHPPRRSPRIKNAPDVISKFLSVVAHFEEWSGFPSLPSLPSRLRGASVNLRGPTSARSRPSLGDPNSAMPN